jgi:hypothetical protein
VQSELPAYVVHTRHEAVVDCIQGLDARGQGALRPSAGSFGRAIDDALPMAFKASSCIRSPN